MARVDEEVRMTIKTLAAQGTSCAQIGRLLSLPESNVRYHLKRLRECRPDGRAERARKADAVAQAIAHWVQQHDGEAGNVAALHDWLSSEHGYGGSLRSVQRFMAARYGSPPRRTRRRVETPPGAQAQLDWAIYSDVWLGGQRLELSALMLCLSHSRGTVQWWSTRRTQLAWISGHNALLQRIGGVPAVIRIDNDTAAVAHGAGPWGRLCEPYRRYAMTMRFHVDLCLPRQPRAKGKIERQVRSARGRIDPYQRHWSDLGELQSYTDAALARLAGTRICPVTGTTVASAWAAERALLAPLPEPLPEPFDTIATRRVTPDCLVAFEGRQYSVPFALSGQTVENRGGVSSVQILHRARLVACHARQTPARLVIDPAHYEGCSSERVIAPPPLGRLGQRMMALAAEPVVHRSVDLYARLAEVAR